MDARTMAPWSPQGRQVDAAPVQRFRGVRSKGKQYSEDYFVLNIPIGALLANGGSFTTSVIVEGDAIFEAYTITGSAAVGGATTSTIPPNVLITISDGSSSRALSSAPMQSVNLLGTGNFCHFFPIPRRFMPNQAIAVTVVNTDTVNNLANFEICLSGKKLYTAGLPDFMGNQGDQFNSWVGQDGKTYAEDLFTYVWNLATLAAGATVAVPVIIDAMSDFEWITTACVCLRNTTTGAGQIGALLQIQVFDGNSNKALFTNPSFQADIAGRGSQVFILPAPRFLPKMDTVTLNFTNLDVVPLNNIQLAMEGRKVFEMHAHR